MTSMLQPVGRLLLALAVAFASLSLLAEGPEDHAGREAVVSPPSRADAGDRPTLAHLKATGLQRSRYRIAADGHSAANESPVESKPREPDLAQFASTIKPLLEQHCIDCHGAETTEGNLRIDTLDPDLMTGGDTDRWLDVFAVITKGEMPPPDQGVLEDGQRRQLVNWLSAELQAASMARRRSGGRSAFRRMTRYEYNYALQDLLGLPWDFAKDLPPEAHSEDGFENSAELLHLSVSQFETYHRIARSALDRATVTGDKPQTRYWGIAMKDAAAREWSKQDDQIKELTNQWKDDPEKLAVELEQLLEKLRNPPGGAYYKDLTKGRFAAATWEYYEANYAFSSEDQPKALPDSYDCVAVLPHGTGSRLIVELGNELPDEGTMRVTVRASRVDPASDYIPSLQLLFGWQASNEGRALLRASDDTPVTAGADQPQIIQWDVELGEIYPRNSVRKTWPMGSTPSPSEYIRLVNSSASPSEIQIDFVQVAAPVYDQWPPESHRRIFGDGGSRSDELAEARETISAFMTRAWRRSVSEQEVNRKLELFSTMRPQCDTFEDAVIEVLAAVLSSPQFLYVTNTAKVSESAEPLPLDPLTLANRLSFFLWCSIPDEELTKLARDGQLTDEDVLAAQVQRMLDDPRSKRLAQHFVPQWLDMQLLDFLNFDQHLPGFDPLLKESMQREPIALFDEILKQDASILDFIHCDYALVNERLARHYGLSDIYGNHFRRVSLDGGFRRGGLLTQAGLLAMNSDWPDSHPLKRAVWLLESVLGDPPPPPPPAVPQIDLADPEIAKMTLKERIEDHRNHAACMSCHVKIDPWGIAFENYDALGQWREENRGKPIDAASELFNHQTIDGMDGLKRFLLQNRQDQFVQTIVSKLATYALGRPLTFADQAAVDAITTRVRRNGDGLRTAIEAIVHSELFRSS
jgi:mono/diheme cytochrome c family protein